MRRQFVPSVFAVALAIAGCARTPEAVVVEAPPPPLAIAMPMPKGAYPGMIIPVRLPDGDYATPNRNLSSAASVWHLRAALNVAALACRGADEATIIADYNALLAREKKPLATAEASYAAEFKAAGGDWRDRYDDGMTRLYNFFSQDPAREGFCAAAATTLADAAFVDDAGLPAFAAGRLAVLEKPFTDFYRAYDAWRASKAQPIYALAATTPPGPAALTVSAPTPTAAPIPVVVRPRLTLDPSVFQDTAVTQ